jgi:hypothetical protein
LGKHWGATSSRLVAIERSAPGRERFAQPSDERPPQVLGQQLDHHPHRAGVALRHEREHRAHVLASTAARQSLDHRGDQL